MPQDSSSGVANLDKPGHWLVPPWPKDAGAREVARHFLRFSLSGNAPLEHVLAYFESYQNALDAVRMMG